MYKVVVVDDEPLILRSIKRSIENAHPDFSVVAEASNGDEAILVIERENPDVVFTDIRMPVTDGLWLIEEIRKRNIETQIVILSGYQEFDYAKKALKFNVEDYLLKPFANDELAVILNRIHDTLENQKKKMQYDLLNSIINSNTTPLKTQIDKYFDCNYSFGAILLYAGFSSRLDSSAQNIRSTIDLNTIIEKYVNTSVNYWVINLNKSSEKLIIIDLTSLGQNEITELCKTIFFDLNKEQITMLLVTGRTASSVLNLRQILSEYKTILCKNVVLGKSVLIDVNDSANSDQLFEPLVSPNLEKLFKLYIENDLCNQFKAEFKKLMSSCNNRETPIFLLERMLKQLLSYFQSYYNVNQNQLIEYEIKIDELINDACAIQSIEESMLLIIDDLFKSRKENQAGKNKLESLVDSIEIYIKQNYAHQISLQTMAEKYGMNLPYLSSIFKKYKGMSPMDYIINLRIEKAKELMQNNPSLAIKNIAQSIGYDDPYYMSRIFKTVTGKSPSEYKNEIFR